jgi:hypothetical protein
MKRKAEIIRRDGRLSIKASIPLQKGFSGKDTAEIMAFGSEVDWEKLCYHFDMRDHHGLIRIARIIYKNIIEPVKDEIFNRNRKIRGVHASRKGESEIVKQLRRYAACMEVYLTHYMRLPREDWPIDLQLLIDKAKKLAGNKQEIRDNRSAKEKLHPIKITYQLWKNEFKESLKHIGMTGPKNFSNFKKVYIHKNPFIEPARHFLHQASTFKQLLDFLT